MNSMPAASNADLRESKVADLLRGMPSVDSKRLIV